MSCPHTLTYMRLSDPPYLVDFAGLYHELLAKLEADAHNETGSLALYARGLVAWMDDREAEIRRSYGDNRLSGHHAGGVQPREIKLTTD